jgi:hypothetical protein
MAPLAKKNSNGLQRRKTMKFSCPETACNFDDAEPYVLNIPHEACFDEHNVATPFCPHCGSKLKKAEPAPEHFEQ